MTTKTISAADADTITGSSWFTGYTNSVELHQGNTQWSGLDAQARADEKGDTEYVLVLGDLAIDGDVDLRSEVQSIYAIAGNLTARRVILGDAVLVVGGTVTATEWVLGPPGEGLFDVAGAQIESHQDALFAHVVAPTVVVFDRNLNRFHVAIDGVSYDPSQLVPEVLDAGGAEIDPARLRQYLEAGGSLAR